MHKTPSYISRLYFSVLLLLLNLAVQIYFKHYLNDIPVYRINFLYLGNIFNILLSFIIILGVVLVHIINRGLEKAEYRLILFVVTIALSSYVLGIVIGKSNYLPLESYLLGYPARKVYLALIFSFNLFTHFYLLSYIWSILIGRQSGGAGKAFTGAFFAFILALAFSFYFVSKQDNRIHVTAATPHYDVSVVLGAAVWSNNQPSTIFQGRIKKAYELFSNSKTSKIQVTGGNAPGEISEAEAAMRYLEKLGVDRSFIMVEETTSTTVQQIQLIKNKFSEDPKYRKISIVSDQFHMARIMEMSKFFTLQTDGIASDYKLKIEKLLYYRLRESIALLLFWLFAI